METNPKLQGFDQFTLKPWFVRVPPKTVLKFDDVLGLTKLGKMVVMEGYSLISARRKFT